MPIHFIFIFSEKKTITFITAVVMEISCLQKKSNCGFSLLILHWILKLSSLDLCSPGGDTIQTDYGMILNPECAEGLSWPGAGAVGIAGLSSLIPVFPLVAPLCAECPCPESTHSFLRS